MISLVVILAMLPVLFLAGPVQGELWLRLTFDYAVGDIVPNDGGSSPDYYGEANNVTITDKAGESNWKVGQFQTGLDSHVTIKSDLWGKLPSDLGDNGFSVAAWVKFDLTAEGYMMIFTTGDNSSTWRNKPSGTAIDMVLAYPSAGGSPYNQRALHDYGNGGSSNLLNSDTWYHLVFTYEKKPDPDPDYIRNSYHNGVNIEVDADRDTLWLDGNYAMLGMTRATGGTGNHFEGEMDQLDIFDHCLDASEVTALYQEGPQRYIPPQTCAEARTAMNGEFKLHYDFNGDCEVNIQDFSVFNQIWLDCIDPDVESCDKPWL